MFNRDDEIIEFLEETMELHIPKELLEDRKQTIEYIEDNLNVEIPSSLNKKKKITKFLTKVNKDFRSFFEQRRFLNRLKVSLFFCVFLIPILIFLYFVSINTDYLALGNLKILFLISVFLLIIIGIFLSVFIFRIQNRNKISWKKRDTILYSTIMIPFTFFSIVLWLLYGNDSSYRNSFIQDVMNTGRHQYLANIFFDSKTIQKSLDSLLKLNYSDVSEFYEFEPIQFDTNNYANSYEKEILTKENPSDIYKMIKVEGTLRDGVSKYSGYMAVVYDPSKVKLATSVGAGTDDKAFGQILSQISKNCNALVAMNAGGFYDPNWDSNGGIPHGLVIKDGKVLTDFRRGIESGGMIGFDENNKLILKRVTAEQAVNMRIRDAVDWGPYLIVDGVNYFKEDTTKWTCARTVIGQRKDGIVLLLVIDGDQAHSKGASYSDLADIMEKYGAYNAANLDGGTSTSMVENHEYINIPFNGKKRTIRSLPNAWVVVE